MSEYRYRLQQGGGKHLCPACKQRRFVRYVDTLTGEEVADDVGRCDRESSCGYHLRPSEHFRQSGTQPTAAPMVRKETKPKPEPCFIPDEIMRASFTAYERNNFALWLCRVFGPSKALELSLAYRIGTSKHWPGAAVFWQVDDAGRIRRGKVMLYNAETGRRVKEPGNMIAGVHWLLKMPDRKPEPCLFGLHLAAADRSKPVAVVESEKSAIIGAGFVDAFIWTATGGKGSLNRVMLEPLQGRRIVLFPDLGAAESWREKVGGLPGVTVSDVLEQRASAEDRAAGLDVADYLLREQGINA
jgi:hypothetical protein